MSLRNYIAIARTDHWVKNIFVIPGIVIAVLIERTAVADVIRPFLCGMMGVCLVASANYVINEWLDAPYDKFHPVKRHRPSVACDLKPALVYMEYALLSGVGLMLGFMASAAAGWTLVVLWVMGILYNVKPFRTKDHIYLDVLSESVNNPIRLSLGWFMVMTEPLPPSSLLLSYWMGGAFLMALKRFAEYRAIGDVETAGLYRRSFQRYNEEKLLISSFFYAVFCALFLGVFLVKHRIELLLSLPAVAILFTWYFHLAFLPDSPVQYPERLHKNKGFMLFCCAMAALMLGLLFVDIPQLSWLLDGGRR